jgi:hypothetical protein
MDDELAWIREKEQVATSSNRGRDLIGVQNLIKKHHALMTEISNHQPQIEEVGEQAEQMINRGTTFSRNTMYNINACVIQVI